jgi:parallel beta-helix repeat protein
MHGLSLTRVAMGGRTWTVDDDGPADHRKIQDAVNNASDGDTILVRPGTYLENLVVNKRVSIFGEDYVTTVIDGNDGTKVVTLAANGIVLSGFTIRGGDEGLVIVANNNNVTGNVFVNNPLGVILDSGCEENVLFDNKIVLSRTYGVYGDRCGTNVIAQNDISLNGWHGVFLYGSAPCVFENNTVFSNGMDGVRIRYSSNNTIRGNIFSSNDNGLCIYSDEDPLRPSGLSKYNIIEKNTLMNNSCGIRIEHAATSATMAGNVVLDNFLAYNSVGLNISGSNGNSVFHNDFVNNSKQASIRESLNNAWDGGYIVGGNYWSDHNSTDLHWGIGQNETGSDGVADSAYVVSANPDEKDAYPFVRSGVWLEALTMSVISPINGMYRPGPIPLIVSINKPVWMSYSLDGEPNVTVVGNIMLTDLPVGLHSMLVSANDTLNNESSSEVLFTITFVGDLSLDGVVNIIDIAVVAFSFGHYVGSERWNPNADLNSDGQINILDIALVAKEFGSEI